jgi:hypothetical protein
MQEGVKWWAISPHQACKQGVFGVTTKDARRGEMVGHFTSPSMHSMQEGVFGVTTKHAGRGEMLGHFTSPSMQARSVWGDIHASKKG